MEWYSRIETAPAICGGHHRVKGGRIAVGLLLSLRVIAGRKRRIPNQYSHFRTSDRRAVFAFA